MVARGWQSLRAHGLAVVAACLFLCLLILAACIGPELPWLHPNTVDVAHISSAPGWSHILGTDGSGRDVLARALIGARTSLLVGVASASILIAIATIVGAVAGYFGGAVDVVIARCIDAMMSIPLLLLALVCVGVFRPGTLTVILVIGLLGWPPTARVIRAEALTLNHRAYVTAGRLAGMRSDQIIRWHILPNLVPLITIASALQLGIAILLESTLSFLGLGVKPPTASLGSIIEFALEPGVFDNQPWIWLPAAALLVGILVSIHLVGDALRGVLDPSTRRDSRQPHDTKSMSRGTVRAQHLSGQADSTDGSEALNVEGLRVVYSGRYGETVAVENVDLRLARGEIIGLVGESGSGKSSLAMAIADLLPPGAAISVGRLDIDGQRVALGRGKADRRSRRAMLGYKVGVVFQDPSASLDPTMTAGRLITEPLRVHESLTRRALQARLSSLLERTDLDSVTSVSSRYPHQLSGGQKQRVGIAMAIACSPRLLIADEPTASLDVTVQAKLLELFRSLRGDLGVSILLISHDLAAVGQIADRIAVMHRGRIVEAGPTEQVIRQPQHPYTQGLLVSAPHLGRGRGKLPIVRSDTPYAPVTNNE
ncbi:MAG TPA: dipeptide/oligopeptide/nickel ABC transporter permease/ATP-binding protein [Acidothermaceae bacterium]